MKINSMLAIGAASVALFLSGCTVEQTEEGNLPDVNVDVEGETRMPGFEVHPADVDVGTTTTEVTVPTVDVNPAPEAQNPPPPAP